MSRQSRIIGLTGGIATGKSMVAADLEARHQVPVLDADVLARELVQPGTMALKQICDRYGDGILQANGQLDRPQLGQIIFADAAERRWLESVIHPGVRTALCAGRQKWVQAAIPVGVMVVPLLFEAQMTDLVDEIWVVACPLAIQIERLMGRDRISLEQAQARIASQMPLATKIAQATVVLSNDGSLAALQAQIDAALSSDPRD
ncbi:dephospho-CoA kinase [Synechococcales cyanobacterium C]|uniref:Dephospho-CoA kinase n=1 Tax=Petrachloros mirabilis ULC683 TaxID=2781853 RepID=A0A8K2ACE6_9CYAN|nr:dephospho-CoA kinase [Petrachloros mirabilis]NCJ05269.1 dephospho-CoA kinase [Petrachloros mirabilis ULC683]